MPGRKAVARLSLIAALAITGGVAELPNPAAAELRASRPMTCTQLPAKLLGGNIKYANAQIVPANTAPAPQSSNFTGTPPSSVTVPVGYCLVVLSYSSTRANDDTPQNITIYVGLPLNSMDGGETGSTAVNPPMNFTTVEGNWNGRTEGEGGGGCTGAAWRTLAAAYRGTATHSPAPARPGGIPRPHRSSRQPVMAALISLPTP